MMEPTDISDGLVAAAAAGDRHALAAVLDAVRPFVVRYCRARLGRDDLAEEVCRSVLAELRGYHLQPAPFLAFVHDIAARWVARAPYLPQGQAILLQALPEPERDVLVLRIGVGLSVDATAEALGCAPLTVRLLQHRGLTQLRCSLPGSSGVAHAPAVPAQATASSRPSLLATQP